MTAALERFVALLTAHGRRPQLAGNGTGKALCPCHDDHNASLSFKPGDLHAGVVAHCFVCSATLDQMLEALGADESDARCVKGRTGARAPRSTRHFLYRDAEGSVRFRVVRREPKGFHQERLDAGEWVKNLKGVELVPYRLPEVLSAIARGETIWFAEGEKNVEDLVTLGLEATCNPGGAGKWRDSYSAMLSGLKRAVLCRDFDDPGEQHVLLQAASIARRAGCAEITVVAFPGPKGWDVSDWLNDQPALDRRARLLEYVASAGHPPHQNGGSPSGASDQTPSPKPLPCTDLGNSERLMRLHGTDLRHITKLGHWLCWERLWSHDETDAIVRCATNTVRSIYQEAAAMQNDERKALARHALRSESARAIHAMIDLAKSGLSISPDALDPDPWAFNCENGTLDLRTGTLREHRREDFITKLAPVGFDPAASHPLWDSFLARMVPDHELRAFLQRAVGYTLTGDTSEEKLFFVHGPTASGKSTFISAITAMLGEYATTCAFETFLHSERSSASTMSDLARLRGVRMAVSLEVEEGRKLAVAVLKSITGRDRITARYLYHESFQYTPAFKLWLVANDKPRASSVDDALWRRILMIPFEESLPTSEQDPHLKTFLTNDPQVRSAILTWALCGLSQWLESGLLAPAAVRRATSQYREEQDTVGEFLDERCVLGSGCEVSNTKIRKSYDEWSIENGERPMSAKAFSIRLKHHGLIPSRTNKQRGWVGVRLRDPIESSGSW